MTTYSIRMRASRQGQHISGAERLAAPEAIPGLAQAMSTRALNHEKGSPDTIHITTERIDENALSTVPALTPVQLSNDSPQSAANLIRDLLHQAGILAADAAVTLAYQLTGLRGAAIVDATTGARVDPNLERGVRVSTFDAISTATDDCTKNHFREAITLASKVQSAPDVLAEICISDDPTYTKGYLAIGDTFYRIPNIKATHSNLGTRIIIVKHGLDLEATIDYLEDSPVHVDLSAVEDTLVEGTLAEKTSASMAQVAARRNEEWAAQGLARTIRTFSTAQLPHSTIDGQDYLLFSSSDYLGLSTDQSLIEASVAATRALGTGSGGSRLTTGTSTHHGLEKRLAEFFGYADCVLFSTGYQANHSTISAIAAMTEAPARLEIFSDAADHASIIDGCRAARTSHVSLTVFPHADYEALDTLLAQSTAEFKLVVSDAVFSMSGEVVDARALNSVCQARDAWLMFDDAHGIGVLGDHGRGTCNHFEIQPDIVVGTASKALGVEGGFVLCSPQVATLLRNRARSFVYSTSMNPGSVAAIGAAIVQLERGDVVKRLRDNIAAVRKLVGLAEDSAASAIIPLPIGDETQAMEVSAQLAQDGIFIPAMRYPTVAKGAAMLRLTITARHSAADIEALGAGLRAVGVLGK